MSSKQMPILLWNPQFSISSSLTTMAKRKGRGMRALGCLERPRAGLALSHLRHSAGTPSKPYMRRAAKQARWTESKTCFLVMSPRSHIPELSFVFLKSLAHIFYCSNLSKGLKDRWNVFLPHFLKFSILVYFICTHTYSHTLTHTHAC